MKKLLSLLSVLAIGATSSLTIVACDDGTKSDIIPQQKNVKSWCQQSSNIAKSIILGKTEKLNTNNILENVLHNNTNNIINRGSYDTGQNYDTFVKNWGYNNQIDGVNSNDFNSNDANTIDNNIVKTKDNFNKVSGILPILLKILKGSLQDNPSFSNFILEKSSDKYVIADLLSNSIDISMLNKYRVLTQYVPVFANLINVLLNNLQGFNAKQVLGQYYPSEGETIKDALFNKKIEQNPQGWIANYHPDNDISKIDSVTKNSDILKGSNQDKFKTWDQVALFKTGADLNYAIKKITEDAGSFNFSDIFQAAITFDKTGKATDFNQDKFAEGLANIYKLFVKGSFLQIVKNFTTLINPLIEFIKYKILGFMPTDTFLSISTSKPTDRKAGVININDLIDKLDKILLTKKGFISFFSDMFFSTQATNDDLFLGMDITCTTAKGSFAVTEIINPIQNQVIDALSFAYDNYIDPTIKKYYIRDIFNNIISDLKSLTNNFDINIKDVSNILSTISTKSFADFLDILFSCKDNNDLQNNWVRMWNAAGLQDKAKSDFAPDSFLLGLHNLFYTPDFTTNLENFIDALSKAIGDGCDTLTKKINDKISQEIDFNNQSLWTINDKTIEFYYNKETNESLLEYSLTYDNKTYQISVVINTNAESSITGQQQVWLKSLSGLN